MTSGSLITLVCWYYLGQLQASAQNDPIPESIAVRYARAQLDLAKLNLTRVEQRNKRVARSVPSNVVAEFQHDVRVAETRLKQATAGESGNEFQIWLQRARAEQRAAESTCESATAANARVPGTFEPLDIERFRLRAEVAKLQLERGESLMDAGREEQLHWKIDLLDNQVQRLEEESSLATPFVGIYPGWRW